MADPEKSPNIQSLRNRDYYRSKLLATPAKRRHELVTVEVNDGEQLEVEVRAPSLAEEGLILKKAQRIEVDPKNPERPRVEIDTAELHVFAAIFCCYRPGTSERIFEEADAAAIREAPVGSWYEALAIRANAIRSTDPVAVVEDARKNSEPTSSAASSST